MRITERFPFWLRLTHWLNVVFLSGMIWSGILIYWAHQAYTPFIPPWAYASFGLSARLAEGLAWHFAMAAAFTLNGLAYVSGLAWTGEWRTLASGRGGFNVAQRFAYSGAIALGAGSAVTGLAVYKPKTLSWLAFALGGYERARLLHFLLMSAFLGFIAVHLVQVARAGWRSVRAMIAGFEEEGP